ncbi:MAG TPA: hypothetical protein DCM26_01750, partial [Desulfotomaculum sp.]|nr:hypothetical protein [Desulfotomaculum sp.]
MRKVLIIPLVLFFLLSSMICLVSQLPASAANTKWDLEGWRVDSNKWMDGLLFTYHEDNWVPYRLSVTDYNYTADIRIQHDYLDAGGHYGIDQATNFFIGLKTDRVTPPESILPIYEAGVSYPDGLVFHVEGPTYITTSNGQEIEYRFIIDNPGALMLLDGFAFYWKAHLAVTASSPPPYGSSWWNGASLHTHTTVTGRQDVPIKTPPRDPTSEPSTVSGYKWNDKNGDRNWDEGEPALEGWTIEATQGEVVKTVGTGSDGSYSFTFTENELGEWTISEVPQTGWQQTYPASPGTYTLNLQSGTNETDRNFGNQAVEEFVPPVVSGYKWNDKNGDGNWDEGEPALEGWTIKATKGEVVKTDVTGS